MKAEYDFSQGKRGAIDPLPPDKTRVTLALDTDILAWFQHEVDVAGGGNYQSLMNAVLKEYIIARQDAFEETLRRIIREELAASATTRRTPAKTKQLA